MRGSEAGGEPLLHVWEGTGVGNVTNPLEASWVPIVFGLGFVLSFGYWTTNFAEVPRALSAKSLGAARRTPLIGAYSSRAGAPGVTATEPLGGSTPGGSRASTEPPKPPPTMRAPAAPACMSATTVASTSATLAS